MRFLEGAYCVRGMVVGHNSLAFLSGGDENVMDWAKLKQKLMENNSIQYQSISSDHIIPEREDVVMSLQNILH